MGIERKPARAGDWLDWLETATADAVLDGLPATVRKYDWWNSLTSGPGQARAWSVLRG